MTRLPESLASYGLSQALFQVLASTHERKYSDVYRRAEELHEFVSQPAFADAALGQILAGMVASFIGQYPNANATSLPLINCVVVSFRKKTFELLSTAYTSIPLPLAQWYLGYPGDKAEEVLNGTYSRLEWDICKVNTICTVALANNWKFDQTTRIFTPSTQPTTSSRGIGYSERRLVSFHMPTLISISSRSAQSTLQALNLVADTVANLEA